MTLTQKTDGKCNAERCSQEIFENGLQKRYKGIFILCLKLKQYCDKWYLCLLFSLLHIARGSDGHLREIYSKLFLLQSRALVN